MPLTAMKPMLPTALVAAIATTLSWTTPSDAMTFTFSQGGFFEDATITGSFEGADLDEDGQIAFFAPEMIGPGEGDDEESSTTEPLPPSELTSFTAMFSGNSFVDPFVMDFDNLSGFVWSLDALLGDDVVGFLEGIEWLDGDAAIWIVGPGPAGLCDGFEPCSLIAGPESLEPDFSAEAVVITSGLAPVPLPASAFLLIGALAGVGAASRRSKRNA